LTIPFGPDGKLGMKDEARWIVDEGGCTVWYDEPGLLKRVQTRVGGRMHVMDPVDFGIRGILESPLPKDQRRHDEDADVDMGKEPPSRRALKRKLEVPQAVVYGARKNDQSLVAAAKQVNAIAPVVMQLGDLEIRVQHLFNRMMWGAYNKEMSARTGTSDLQKAIVTTASSTAPSGGIPAAAAEPVTVAPQKPKKKMRW
jgi:hypothetical protein